MSVTSRAASDRGAAPSTALLVGRPNAGKSSIFNRLTGGDAKVGNFPGITVELLDGEVRLSDDHRLRLVDVPGVYSLSGAFDPDSDEGVARLVLEREPGALLVQVADATQLALHLRLTRELIALGRPLLLVVSHADGLSAQGKKVDTALLERELGVRVLFVSARDARARVLLRRALLELIQEGRVPPACRHGRGELDALAAAAIVPEAGRPARAGAAPFAVTKRIDAVVLHPLLGPVLFLGVMAVLFAAVFFVAEPFSALVEQLIAGFAGLATAALGDGLLSSLIRDGVLAGAGTVLTFLPQIVVLTVALELIESSGYLARGAFLIDRPLRLIGLGGRSFVPMLTAHACAVPAISATRIIRDGRQRLRTLLVLPLLACSARVPTYALLIQTFFGERSAWFKSGLFMGLYFAGLVCAATGSWIIHRAVRPGNSVPLALEMPAYRLPQGRDVGLTVLRSARHFVKEVGTFILIVSVVLWGLLSIPAPSWSLPASARADEAAITRSVGAAIGYALEPATRPLGFDWRINVGLLGSFGAREVMVSTLGVSFGLEAADDDTTSLSERIRSARRSDGTAAYGGAMALALMAFFVIACQCMSTVAALRRETRTWRWPLFVLGYTYVGAYLAALVVFQTARALGH